MSRVSSLLGTLRSRLEDVFAAAELPAARLLSSLVQREAAVMAYNDAFLVLGFVLLTGLVLIPLLRREHHSGAAPP